jgi:iron(III) transport system ATP-binding protein
VARFTGLSGELPVRIRRTIAGGLVEVDVGIPAGPLQARAPSSPLASAAARLLIRPTGVRLCSARGDEHHLTAAVADVAFRGRGYEHAVDVPGLARLTGVFAETRAARGKAVGLRLDAAGCHLFAETAAAGCEPAGRAGQERTAGVPA